MERKKHTGCPDSSNLGEERFRRKISKVKMLSGFLKGHKDSYSIKKKIERKKLLYIPIREQVNNVYS